MSRCRHHKHPWRVAFTLVELLVVISITALLIALLLPALGKAKVAAQTAECLAREHQFALFINAYVNDKRWYPVNSTSGFDPAYGSDPNAAVGHNENFGVEMWPYLPNGIAG